MSLTAQQILDTAWIKVNEQTGGSAVRWPTAEALTWLNRAALEIVNQLPSSHAKHAQPVVASGSKQDFAGLAITDGLQWLDVVCMDSGTTVTANLGFEPASNTGTPAANATYFASASTVLRAAAMTDFNFDPIVFNEPVWITLIPAAGPTTTAGTVSAIVYGEMVGAK